ncbi:MAG: c-type cytochrome [Cryomorphaceae bacterium]|nr:c-type cytochrome [Cryomorphaceae bacterium]
MSMSLFAQDESELLGDPDNGKKIFTGQCAACHKLDKKAIGPALGGVAERRDMDWIIAWTRNNAQLRASGDKDAIAIFEEYNGSLMPAFEYLSEQDVKDIVAYTMAGAKPKPSPDDDKITTTEVGGDSDDGSIWIILGLAIFLIVLIAILVKVKNTLKVIKGDPTSSLLEDASVFTKVAVRNRKVITLFTIVVAIFLLNQLYWSLMSIGVEEGYQPEQPIAFSHKLHAGDNQIDCQYCHYGAEKGKHSNIPSVSVCMNCHQYVQEGPKHGEKEIDKIYAAVGFDRETSQYIEGYEKKPVKWVRIHNLPDLAYFSHAQHVNAGNIECQTCHGPVEEMEEVYQYSPLTMGWCINCHRETEVDTKENGYYEEMHEKLKAKHGTDKITVDMIGGLECGKCHY